MRLTFNQLVLHCCLCAGLLGVIVWVIYTEYNRPWRHYQREYSQLEYRMTLQESLEDRNDRGTSAQYEKKLSAIRDRKPAIRQIWLKELGETDRCVTCHLGVENPSFGSQKQPYTTHSGSYLKYHPVEEFGCVICHAGQGPALMVGAAHGEEKNWARPLLKGVYAQSSCGTCHPTEQGLPLNSEVGGASTFMKGWRLFHEYGCLGCHELRGYERPDRIGPGLTYIGSKVNGEWLMKWLRNPYDYQPDSKMPRFDLSDEEIGYIVAYLMSLTWHDVPQSVDVSKKLKSSEAQGKGKNFIHEFGCLGCHKLGNEGKRFGPDFTKIGTKVTSEWLYRFLSKPKAYDPETIIPDFTIPGNELPDAAAYLLTLQGSEEISGTSYMVESSDRDIEKGRKLVREIGCTGCHQIENLPSGYDAPELDGIGSKRVDELAFGNAVNIERTLKDWIKTKITDPRRFQTDTIVTRMPSYDFSEDQAESLAVFLFSIRETSVAPRYRKVIIDEQSVEPKGQKIMEKYNCGGCHKINNEGGTVGPDLTEEAKKSRTDWLFNYLKKPYKIRPGQIMKAQMPDFTLSDSEVNSVIEYFSYLSGKPYPYMFESKKEISPEDIRYGEKLYHEVFACIGCHTVEGIGGQVGPDHTDLASRLKGSWIEKWLQNPQEMKPDVRMPRFEFEDWEFEALTHYLMTLGKYRFIQVRNTEE